MKSKTLGSKKNLAKNNKRNNGLLIYAVIYFGFYSFLPSHAVQAAGIASAHPLATEAGHEVMQLGGNVFDAAVAVSAALAVVEPTGSGLGGGGFWLLHRSNDKKDIMIDGRETAPAAAHRDMYLDKNGEPVPGLSVDGPLSAGIPGLPAALVHLSNKYGRLPLKQNLTPAIRLAKEGFPVTEHYRRMVSFRIKALQSSHAAAAIFLHAGESPPIGYIIKQPDLARVFEAMAATGRDGFYSGIIAQKLVDGVKKAGGIWSLQDLKSYQVVERKPVYGNYNGTRITSVPPPSSGGIALLSIFNILDAMRLHTYNPIGQKHVIIEAMRRAYRDRAEFLGDSDFISVPVQRLTHPFYASGLSASIRLDRATPSNLLPGVAPVAKGSDTTHFSIMDKDGNRVAATLTINFPFGSGFVPADTGVLLNDEMDDFSIKPGIPNVYGLVGAEANAIAPGKRPLSSMSPTFLQNDRGIAVLGTPGGSRIITMVLLAALDYIKGGTVNSMVNVPRYHHQYLPDTVQYEKDAFSAEEIEQLKSLGHTMEESSYRFGNMQVVIWDRKSGQLSAASDPRVSGFASIK